jgi:hypothetical protein
MVAGNEETWIRRDLDPERSGNGEIREWRERERESLEI